MDQADMDEMVDIMRQAYMDQFQLNEREAAYLMMITDHPDAQEISPATFVDEIKQVGIEQLEGVDPLMFIETARARQMQHNAPETREERVKRRKQSALSAVKAEDEIETTWRPVESGEALQKRNEELLKKKMEHPRNQPLVSTKFLRDRTGGRTRQELLKEFNNQLAISVKYDIWLELLNEDIEELKEALEADYRSIRQQLLQLIIETEQIGADSRNANEIKSEVRDILHNHDEEIEFFKGFRILASKIDKRKEVKARARKAETNRDGLAELLHLTDEVEARYNQLAPKVRSFLISQMLKQKKTEE